MSDLAALAERVEQAEGPSRELFEEAFWAVMPNYADIRSFRELLDAKAWVDAAMTLVLEGLMFTVSQHEVKGAASIFRRNDHGERATCCPLSVASTPALALCAAALRARSAHGQDDTALSGAV